MYQRRAAILCLQAVLPSNRCVNVKDLIGDHKIGITKSMSAHDRGGDLALSGFQPLSYTESSAMEFSDPEKRAGKQVSYTGGFLCLLVGARIIQLTTLSSAKHSQIQSSDAHHLLGCFGSL